MSEDQRATSNVKEPDQTGPAGAERWADYLDWARADLIEGILSLPEHELRRSRLPSAWSPIELMSHLLHMEQRWFIWGFLAEPVANPFGDWNVAEPWAADAAGDGAEARWLVEDHVSAEHLAAELLVVGARTRAILRDHPLETRARTGGRFTDDPPTLEWICFHVLAEYARHAGQFDIVAELSRG